MPMLTYLSDYDVAEGLHVNRDAECDELLQRMNRITNRRWVILIDDYTKRRLFKKEHYTLYTLYLDCHGEWQLINLPVEEDFMASCKQSRFNVMSYMLGYLGNIQ